MESLNMVDISEEDISSYGRDLLKILLKDRTTQKNIIWATSDYANLGISYAESDPIEAYAITGINNKIIQPRVAKRLENQMNRTREKAEVFTPSWVCNMQNNLIDNAWFGRKDVFNTAHDKSWKTNEDKIEFAAGRSWKDYVDTRRIEIACGEAPYLVSRYDTVTGNAIRVSDRIGLLDRKLRVVHEHTEDTVEWFKWVERAYQSIYGYEYQGDNLLLARENLLYTFIEHKFYKFKINPTIDELKKIATIISWNIWQMDGITKTIPLGAIAESNYQIDVLAEPVLHAEAKYCKVKDWRSKKIVEFKELMKG